MARIMIFVSLVLLTLTNGCCGFVLRIPPSLQLDGTQNSSAAIGGLVIVNNSRPTDLSSRLQSDGESFGPSYTYLPFEWYRQNATTEIRYLLTLTSSNTRVMAEPKVTGIPLAGAVRPVYPEIQTFNTTLDCLAKGTAVVQLSLEYNVSTQPVGTEYQAILRMRKACEAPSNKGSSSGTDTTAVVTVSTVFGSLALLVVLGVLFLLRFWNKIFQITRQEQGPGIEMAATVNRETAQAGDSAHPNPCPAPASSALAPASSTATLPRQLLPTEFEEPLRDYLLPEENITLGNELGNGCYGVVYKAQLTLPRGNAAASASCATIAVKTIKSTNVTPAVTKETLLEVVTMARLRHPNVVELIGIYVDSLSAPNICLEYMANGDLRNVLLRGNRPGRAPIASSLLRSFIQDIASGMVYLESMNVVHRDLAARNCMVNSRMTVKIGDFGLARTVSSEEENIYRILTARQLPMKSMAPECLVEHQFSSKSDVWAFGVTVWEVYSLGEIPYAGVPNCDLRSFHQRRQYLQQPNRCSEEMYELCQQCWIYSAWERPTFLQVNEFLLQIIQ